ncbi:MAG: SRPBCC domain-containing protein [Desulfobacterales bacterium]|nr:SRPBCC domain-containing protein [Deltaproteobacteria bacterium]NNK97029.1 SRPBCC domain-containing protein [Desulfobacterales bacterium]
MKTYNVAVTINADVDRIWSILTHSSKYAEWNASVEKIEGDIALGQKIKVYAKITPDRAFPVKVVELIPSRKMVWLGGMPLGLFKGIRTFTLESKGAGTAEFLMHEVFSGLLAPLITRFMPDLTDSFHQFAHSLKRKAESMAEK